MAGVPPAPVGPKWEEAGTTFEQRCAFVAIWGNESSGKTTLALSAPGPVALIHSAEKVNGVVEPFVRKGKKVRKHNFGFTASKSDEDTANRARSVWGGLKAAYDDAMDKWAKSVIIDTEPDAWVLRRFARFGTLTPQGDLRDLYNAVNFDWTQMFKNKFRGQVDTRKCNVITIHTAKDEYKDVIKKTPQGAKKTSERTGRQKLEGHKGIPYWADVILYTCRPIDTMEFTVRIDKPWFNGAVQGMELTNEVMVSLGYSGLNFPSIMAFITETPEEEWAR